MAPTIHLVRHAQGVHNLTVENETIRDPDLTPLGVEQCSALRSSFIHHDNITRLIASPLRRTLHTCINAFGPDPASDPSAAPASSSALLPVLPLPILQEVSDAPCDTGSVPEDLNAEFGLDKVDTRALAEDWMDKKSPDSPYEPTIPKLMERAQKGRRLLRDLAGDPDSDDHIVVVTHGGFLHFLTDDWFGIPSGRATGWSNCEYRSYQFVDKTGQDEDAALEETHDSFRRRHGMQQAPTSTEQKEMRAAVQKTLSPLLKIKS